MRRLALALVAALLMAGCTGPPTPPGEGNGTTPPPPPPGGPTPRPAAGFNPIVKLGTDRGDIYLEVFEDMVPVTAANFLKYAGNGFYEGIKIHRVRGPTLQPPNGFMVQMGDPNTRDPLKGPETWGQGDPNLPRIPDEFHPSLRHDAAGVVSMANSGPNSGTSQFFITLDRARHLDDRHAIFGKVVAGLDVVRAIGNVNVVGERPVEEIVLRSTEVLAKQRDPAAVRHGLTAWSYTPALNTTPGRVTTLHAVVQNTGNVTEAVNATLVAPENWTWVHGYPQTPNVAAGMGQLFLFAVTPSLNATVPGTYPVTVRFSANGTTAEVTTLFRLAPLGDQAGMGSQATVHYIGTLTDGRLFDSDQWAVVSNASIPKFVGSSQVPGEFTPRPQATGYNPLGPFEVGAPGLIQGFTDGVLRLREGESRTLLIPPERAYGSSGHPLSGRTLVFTIELLRVEASSG